MSQMPGQDASQPLNGSRPRRELAVCEITTRNWTFEQDVRAYVAAGIDALGIYRPKLDGIGVANAARTLREAGLPARSMISMSHLAGAGDSLPAAVIDDHMRLLDECALLGVETLVVVPGMRHGRSVERVEALAIDALGRLASAAAERDVVLALEPIRAPYFDCLNTLSDAEKMVRTVALPGIGIVFDTWHLWNEAGLKETLKSAADLIRLVHISDWRDPPREHDDRLVPGEGVMPLAGIVRYLDELGYAGAYEVEIFSKDVWASDYHDVLRRCRRWFDGVWGDERQAVQLGAEN
jgi:sugar phosphate isomerase/epimerase